MRKQISSTKNPGKGMYAGTDKPTKPARPASPPPTKKKPA
jgi:hypothetical protein